MQLFLVAAALITPKLIAPSAPQIFERNPTTVKNFGVWLRYQSRTGYHNMYKEYRDTTLNGAIEQMYQEMGSRHRVRAPCVQIIKTATVRAADCKRANIQQFHDSKIAFPITRKMARCVLSILAGRGVAGAGRGRATLWEGFGDGGGGRG